MLLHSFIIRSLLHLLFLTFCRGDWRFIFSSPADTHEHGVLWVHILPITTVPLCVCVWACIHTPSSYRVCVGRYLDVNCVNSSAIAANIIILLVRSDSGEGVTRVCVCVCSHQSLQWITQWGPTVGWLHLVRTRSTAMDFRVMTLFYKTIQITAELDFLFIYWGYISINKFNAQREWVYSYWGLLFLNYTPNVRSGI